MLIVIMSGAVFGGVINESILFKIEIIMQISRHFGRFPVQLFRYKTHRY